MNAQAVSELPIVIIGAGLAGLATAKCLTKSGHRVIVLEQSHSNREQGYAITLRSWAYQPLIALLDDNLDHFIANVVTDRAVGGRGFIDTDIHNVENNEVLLDLRTNNEERPLRANRAALRAYLSSGLDVRYATTVTGLKSKHNDRVDLELDNGELLQARYVIAADGMFSSTRKQLLPDVKPALVPSTNYQGQLRVPQSDFDTYIKPSMNGSNTALAVTDNVLIGVQVVDYDTNNVQMSWNYIGKNNERPANDDVRDTAVEADEVLKFVADLNTAPPYNYFFTQDSLKQSGTDLYHWNMHAVTIELEALQKVTQESKVCFIGDAAHGMPIFAGEGGNHAILDAVELTNQVTSSNGDVAAAVNTFLPSAHTRWYSAVQRSTEQLGMLCRPIAEWRALAAAMKGK